MKRFYEIVYRYFRAPWDIGAREELIALVEGGRIKPCRAIDLGCGTGANAIFLAQKGFEVTGVDFAVAAIDKAKARASEANVHVEFIVDDLTNLQVVSGTFDFHLDYRVLDDLRLHQRRLYVRNMLPLTHAGSRYLLCGFEYPLQDPSGAFDIPGALIYMALAGSWIWSLLAAARGSRGRVLQLRRNNR
jgi:SAM-dependent methyltransferase